MKPTLLPLALFAILSAARTRRARVTDLLELDPESCSGYEARLDSAFDQVVTLLDSCLDNIGLLDTGLAGVSEILPWHRNIAHNAWWSWGTHEIPEDWWDQPTSERTPMYDEDDTKQLELAHGHLEAVQNYLQTGTRSGKKTPTTCSDDGFVKTSLAARVDLSYAYALTVLGMSASDRCKPSIDEWPLCANASARTGNGEWPLAWVNKVQSEEVQKGDIRLRYTKPEATSVCDNIGPDGSIYAVPVRVETWDPEEPRELVICTLAYTYAKLDSDPPAANELGRQKYLAGVILHEIFHLRSQGDGIDSRCKLDQHSPFARSQPANETI